MTQSEDAQLAEAAAAAGPDGATTRAAGKVWPEEADLVELGEMEDEEYTSPGDLEEDPEEDLPLAQLMALYAAIVPE